METIIFILSFLIIFGLSLWLGTKLHRVSYAIKHKYPISIGLWLSSLLLLVLIISLIIINHILIL